ncbi:hypothetical protein GCM10022225_07730 [Plantactinospora mayteni]|nr:GNAT family N-acetyltransferase [Plantactinospora mayteni]
MPVSVLLRVTPEQELDAMVRAEARSDTRRWLGDVSVGWHRAQLASPDTEHLSIVREETTVGFVVLAGLTSPHRSIELRRVMVFHRVRNRGVGRSAMVALLDRAFGVHGAHRVWLDVKPHNSTALRLYRSVGLVVEGELREAMAEPEGGFTSLIVMGILDREWAARRKMY